MSIRSVVGVSLGLLAGLCGGQPHDRRGIGAAADRRAGRQQHRGLGRRAGQCVSLPAQRHAATARRQCADRKCRRFGRHVRRHAEPSGQERAGRHASRDRAGRLQRSDPRHAARCHHRQDGGHSFAVAGATGVSRAVRLLLSGMGCRRPQTGGAIWCALCARQHLLFAKPYRAGPASYVGAGPYGGGATPRAGGRERARARRERSRRSGSRRRRHRAADQRLRGVTAAAGSAA